MLRFVEDLQDHLDRKARELHRDQRRRAKQMFRAANEAIRAEIQDERRERRSAKRQFAY
jgi:hypothetical protein